MIGNGASAYDISRDISTVAKEVHLSSRAPDVKFSKLDHHPNIWQHSAVRVFFSILKKVLFWFPFFPLSHTFSENLICLFVDLYC